MTKTPKSLRPASLLVHGGTMRSEYGETSEALFLSSGFVYDSAEQAEQTFLGEVEHFQYSRFGNPTVQMLEQRLALLEGAEACRATATGMAAVSSAMLSHLKAGDRVVAARALFGSCHWIVSTLLPRYGIETVFVEGADLGQWRQALSTPTQLVLVESPSNPMLEIVDLQAVADLAHAAGAIVVVDNVFATPLLQHPFKLGADVVVYSCTKHIDGQGRVLGGAVLGRKKWVEEVLQPFTRNTGPAMSPFNAWLLLKGLETLSLRVDASCRAAEQVAQFLESRPRSRPRLVSDAGEPSAARSRHAPDVGRRHAGDLRPRQQGGRLPLPQPPWPDCDLEQPWRFQVAHHPIRRRRRICASARRSGRGSASGTARCVCRWGLRTWPTSSRIWGRRWMALRSAWRPSSPGHAYPPGGRGRP